ncbi:hypothetical protein Amet_4354 [Alkaliphilus metalliredigens QYMF]|uniref:DUF3277 domain-containing protein n=1 Tax=Alkaliphilus metalliredigens (strain QYMF) TaxID=293826 RepID=A6TKD7_ALKMQ|nr:hypothetical protein [Alkaliphilus metalliredigens]ABR46655.1 hypothetical protein Amet_0427 [Alkaliphilus metalliredigens QYMF]ABR48127.1 hypothetical protein Amet_1964 [Alkaliphilus metalliredigens QYMF]ABR50428.1 hypothetical protein Amet_4354 [Alkaliphilus metalliredigens QYMF]
MVTTYDMNGVNVIVGGRFITGFADGTAITSEANEDKFSVQVGVKGEVTFSETNDPTGAIGIILKQTSPSVPYLDGLANRKGENAIVSAQIVDLTANGVNAGGNRCRVTRTSKKEFSNSESKREYRIYVADYSAR